MRNKSKQPLRFGIIGCSQIAKKSMLPAMRDSNLANLVMIGSRSEEKAKSFAKQFHCSFYGSYDDVLGNKNIDAVYISLPIAMHEEWSVKAAKAKKHVLCEKPATIMLASAKRMVEMSRKNKVRIMEGLMFRYHPQHAKIKKIIEDGVLGELLKFEGCFAAPMPEESDNILNSALDGGYYNHAAPYPICASRMVFKEEPLSVACNFRMDLQRGVDTKADMLLGFSNGKSALISCAIGSYYQSTYGILGTKAHLKVARAYAVPSNMVTKIFLDINDETAEIAVEPADQFKLMIDDFCEEILKGDVGVKDYENDLLAQARILEAGRISAKEGRIVYLSELV